MAYEKSFHLKTASGVQNTPYWSCELGNLCKRAKKAWNYRLTDPDAYKNAKNDRLRRISVGRLMAYNHQPDHTKNYPRTMTRGWLLFDFR
jgi:hypothetical protein